MEIDVSNQDEAPHAGHVQCPRCKLRRSLAIHMITAGDSMSCPRCEGDDGLSIPMFMDGGGRFERPGGRPDDLPTEPRS